MPPLYERKDDMNRLKTTVIISAILSLYLMTVVFASGTLNWYVKHNKDHKRPELDGGLNIINEHNAYYLGDDEKVIYLTFDAGYENGNVEKILDVLKKHNAPAAFFVLENLITRNTALVKRMADEGHLVCNHTATHKNMSKINDKEAFISELRRLEDVYREYTGKEIAKFYRPPEGSFNEKNLEFADEMGYKTVFWSFAYADWDNNKQPECERALDKILSHTHNGEIMLLHPTSSTNAEILDSVITQLKAQGYRLGHLEELCKS